MVKEELVKRSPLRILEKGISGGLGGGNIGVLSSRKGVGKTACLVHIATDQLFQDKHVIHVSFSDRTDHIITWYEDIFSEIAKKRNLEKAVEIHDEMIKNRVIMSFKQSGADIQSILKSVKAMICDGGFQADVLVFDGFSLDKAASDDLQAIKAFIQDNTLEAWFSVTLEGEEPLFDDLGVPVALADYLDFIDVIISLRFHGDHVRLQLAKDHDNDVRDDMHLMLDPKTLLIAEEV